MSDSSRKCHSSDGFFSIPPEQFAALSSLLGFLFASDLDVNQQNSLGNFLINIGQVMVTIAAQKELLESQRNNQQTAKQLELIKMQIDLLEKQYKK